MKKSPTMTSRSAPIRVMLADDDPIFVEVASAALRRMDCAVVVADDGAAALHALLQDEFDVALVDLSMPHVDGFRLIGMIRATSRLSRLPIMVLTVRDDAEAIEEARRLGVDDFMTKPVNWGRFRLRLLQVVAASRSAPSQRAAIARR